MSTDLTAGSLFVYNIYITRSRQVTLLFPGTYTGHWQFLHLRADCQNINLKLACDHPIWKFIRHILACLPQGLFCDGEHCSLIHPFAGIDCHEPPRYWTGGALVSGGGRLLWPLFHICAAFSPIENKGLLSA